MKKRNPYLPILGGLLILNGCMFKADEVKLEGFNRQKKSQNGSVPSVQISVSEIILKDDKLTIKGAHLDTVTISKIQGGTVDATLSIISQNADELVLSSLSVINLALNTTFDLILTNAYGQSVTSVQFNLEDGSVTTAKIADSAVTTLKLSDGAVTAQKLDSMSAGIGQVLKYTGSGWAPGDLSSLTYAGNWNATSNSPDLSGGGNLGEFYIVTAAGSFNLAGGPGTNSWSVGDWVVWNNVVGQWEKIDNATNVQSFNGRSGTVSPQINDYTWAQIDKTTSAIGDIADIDLSIPATTGQVLKFDGTNWIASDDLSSGGAGSVSSSEIADSTIVNADISASAAIDQSKISGLTALASSVSTNTSSISTNTSNISTNTSNISSNTSAITSLNTSVGAKAAASISLTAGDGLSGGGDLSANRSFSVNVDNTTIEIATDILQVKNIADTKLTTACADGEVLTASSGAFVCAASTTIGNWTESSGDLYYTVGNIGIGSSSPSTLLYIEKNQSAQTAASVTNTDSTGSAGLTLFNDSSSAYLSMYGSASTAHGSKAQNRLMIGVNSGSPGIGFRADSGNYIWHNGGISSSGYESMRVGRAGAANSKLGLGVGYQASNSGTYDTYLPTYNLSIGAYSNIAEKTLGVERQVHPSIFGGHHLGIYGGGSALGSTDSNGGDLNLYSGLTTGTGTSSINFYTPTPQGSTSSTDNSYSQAMIINASGQVGIGTTSPTSSLTVNGTITATNFSGDGSGLTNISASSTNQVSAAVGSVGAPSISFSGDSDTGLFQSSTGSNSIDVSVGGTNIFNLSSSGFVSQTIGGGSVSTGNGNATSPTFSFAGDTDTGWYRPTDNTLAASTGGVERIRLDSSGYIGIGTSSPSHTLDILTSSGSESAIQATSTGNVHLHLAGGASSYQFIRYFENSVGQWEIGNSSGDSNTFYFNPNVGSGLTNAAMVIQHSGNIGVGTTSPQVTLDVAGQMRLSKMGSAPFTCDSAHDGAIALTELYTTCVCRNGVGWVLTANGSTSCDWANLPIVVNGSSRNYSGGSYAVSCNKYKNPDTGFAYSGATGDGIYTIDPDGAGGNAAFDVYCDMTTDGGGWSLIGYSYVASTSTNASNRSMDNFSVGAGTYDSSARSGTNASLAATDLAQISTEVGIGISGTVNSGNLSAHTYYYKFNIPNPSAVDFRSPSYTNSNGKTCVSTTLTNLADSLTYTRYVYQEALGVSWSDSNPTSFGVSDTSTCIQSGSGRVGPSIPSSFSGTSSGNTPSNTTYVYLGARNHSTTGMTGDNSFWLR